MKYIPATLISTVIFLITASCSHSADSDSVTYDVTADVTQPAPALSKKSSSATRRMQSSSADVGSEPYKLGRAHARHLHENCRTKEAVCDELLDINARVTNIQARIGTEAANDYLHGLKDYLTEQSDTLADIF